MKLFWWFPLGFLLQQYQPIFMLSLVNFYSVRTKTVMQTFSIMLSVLMIVVCVIVLPIIFAIARAFPKKEENEKDTNYTRRFGVLNDGFHYDNWISRHWNLLTLSRWLVVSIILVCLREYYCFQL